MKTVIVEPRESNVVPLEIVDEEKYYGVTVGNSKGFITKTSFHNGSFHVRARTAVTVGNDWNTPEFKCLQDAIRQWMELGRAFTGSRTVVEFDTYQELFKWLSE